ncbi:MAG: Holliday junction branch migration protein RuvA [Cyanobacteria bacterium KgW148]|nr:Holliday junction branch migration protein RuvA [Cyanobacteria bacterium KgW148]
MIGFLRGVVVGLEPDRKRVSCLLSLAVGDWGYDLHITARHGSCLKLQDSIEVFTHLQVREDQLVLFGFPSKAERDLFRLLIQVSGIGTQMGLALLHTLGLTDLVKAIVTANIRLLCLTPGVGTKTAERLALELKTKLSDYRSGVAVAPNSQLQGDVEMTLMALGYTTEEIGKAMQALTTMPQLRQNEQLEDWLRAAIEWLTVQGA